jgi:hypothetical protein
LVLEPSPQRSTRATLCDASCVTPVSPSASFCTRSDSKCVSLRIRRRVSVVTRLRPRLWCWRNLAPAGEESCSVLPAVTRLLSSAARRRGRRRVRFVRSGPALWGVVKRAVPLLQNETQNMNTTEDLITTGCPAVAP